MAASKSKVSKATEESVLLHLDPSEILAEGNSRYGMRDTASLKSGILAAGGVMEPVEIELLDTPSNGHKYRLVFGFRRHAVVTELNKEGAGLKLPCIIHKNETPIERTKRQVIENLERESLSLMDQAVSMKQMLDSGLSRAEVREVFRSRSKKGKPQPISNSYLNMLVSFLDFPKKIRDRIHNDEIGVAAAYELRKAPPEKWESILDRIEAETVKVGEIEEKEEKRFLDDQKKAAEATEKQQAMATELETARKKAIEIEAIAEAKIKEADKLYQATKVKGLDKEAKKAADIAFAKSEQEKKIAMADSIKATEEVKALVDKATKAAELAKERTERLAKAREAKTKKVAVSPQDVKKGVAAATGDGPVPLNRSEILKVVEELCLPGGVQGVTEIGKALRDCFAGIDTDKKLYKRLSEIVS